MNSRQHGTLPGKKALGFSLVEVVLAVGIIAFVLSSIMGLMTLAVRETREADTTVRLGLINARISSIYRSQSRNDGLSNLAATYYTFEGQPTNAAGAYFQCDLTNVSPAGLSTNLAFLRLIVRWPVPQLASSNTSLISLGNFQ